VVSSPQPNPFYIRILQIEKIRRKPEVLVGNPERNRKFEIHGHRKGNNI